MVHMKTSMVRMGECTTRNLAFMLQLMAGIATNGLFFRIMSDLSLPLVFIFLPVSLLVLPFITRFTSLLEDESTRDTVTGVLTGVTCSFPVVVTHVQQIQVYSLSPWTERFVSVGAALLRSSELLFIPLLLATILLSFAKTIERFPSSVGLATAAATAFSADFTIMTCYVMLRVDDTRGSDVIAMLLLLLIPFFLLCLLPLVRDKQRAWILTLMIMVLFIFWEVIFVGATLCIWSISRKTFPVPACLIGVIFVFHSTFLDWDKLRELDKRGAGRFQAGITSEVKDHKIIIHPPEAPWSGLVSNGLLWHCLAYCVERLALGHTFTSGSVKDSGGLSNYMVLGLFVLVMSSHIEASRTYRVMIVGFLIVVQLCSLMAFHTFRNTYAVEILMGMTLVCITDPFY